MCVSNMPQFVTLPCTYCLQAVTQTRRWTERQLRSYIRFNMHVRKSEHMKRELKQSTTKYLQPPKSALIQ